MLKTKSTLLLVLIVILSDSGYSQEYNKNGMKNFETIDENKLYSFVEISDKVGNNIKGFLLDLKPDTLVLLVNNQTKEISMSDISTLKIETNKKGGTEGVVIGGIMGTYLFYAAFWTNENEPFAYYEMDSPGGQLLLSVALGAFLGSGIGYLIGISTVENTETFKFTGNDEIKEEEYQRLENFLSGDKQTSKLHIYFQLSQVSTRLSEEENNNLSPFAYDHITSFNLVRKIQLTYSILNELEIGGAVCWFGEPRVKWYSNSTTSQTISSALHIFKGVSYYALAVYNPLKSVFPKSLSLNFGLGIGTGNVDYKFAVTGNEYSYYSQPDSVIAQLKKNIFSALFYTQLDLFIYDSFSMGFIADYVYLPEVIPGVPELNISSRNLGSFSFGLTIGLHF